MYVEGGGKTTFDNLSMYQFYNQKYPLIIKIERFTRINSVNVTNLTDNGEESYLFHNYNGNHLQ